MALHAVPENIANIEHWPARVDLAAAFRWTAPAEYARGRGQSFQPVSQR